MALSIDPTGRVYEDGTRYHLPSDAPEKERLDAQSNCIVAMMNYRPFHAPLSNPQRILDIGCGTGSMTHLLASMYPSATVIGVDLAVVPASRHGALPNLHYVQGDIADLIKRGDADFAPGSFDYIFSRLIILGLTDWPGYLTSTTSLLRPGGWFEQQEADLQIRGPNGERVSDTLAWYPKFHADSNAIGLEVEVGSKLVDLMRAVPSLENVRETVYGYPTHFRPGKDREDMAALIKQLPGIYGIALTKISSTQRGKEEVQEMMDQIKETWERGFEDGTESKFYSVVAQRKLE